MAVGKTTAQRGYGAAHDRLRKRWKPIVDAGEAICARCHQPIFPGTPWDLGHDDKDRGKYNGPEHRRCNRGEPSRRKNAVAPSREW